MKFRIMKTALAVAAISFYLGTNTPILASEKTIGGSAADRGVHISATSDGGYIVAGVTASSGSGGDDAFLVRLDQKTEVVWTRTVGGTDEDAAWAAIETPDQGFAVVGFTRSSGAGGLDCSLFATSQDGTVLWTKSFGGSRDDRCWAIAPSGDGGYVLAGETASRGAGERDCFVIRTDGEGNEVWSQAFGGEKDDRCFSVAAAPDGGFVVAGQTFSEGAGDRDAWVLKTDADGTLVWSTTHGGEASDVAHSVVSDGRGSYLATGYTTSLADSPDDPMILKLGSDGEIERVAILAMPGHNRAITGALTDDGGLCLAGLTIDGSPPTGAAMIAKIDADGELLWTKRAAPTTRGDSFGYGVAATADGGCIIVGHTTENSAGSVDLLVATADSSGH